VFEVLGQIDGVPYCMFLMKVKKIVYMKNKYTINDLSGLKARQMALLLESDRHAEEIFKEARSCIQDFSIVNLFKEDPRQKLNLKFKKQHNSSLLSSKILSLALPLILNRTIFKGSGLVTRAAVGMISSKTGANIGSYLIKCMSIVSK